MTKELVAQTPDFTKEELELIKGTIAKDASDAELKLFLYRCKNLGLDPLKTGQVHFIKYGSSPGAIVVGLDGFRSIAQRTGKHSGTERGVTRDKDGKIIGGWAKVYRKDWERPAHEEVSMAEFNTGKAMWAKFPETMIKKVAECAALRMAFPDDTGDLYTEEEVGPVPGAREPRAASIAVQAAVDAEPAALPEFVVPPEEAPPLPQEHLENQFSIGEYVFKTGTGRKGKRIKDFQQTKLEPLLAHYENEVAAKAKWTENVEVQEDFFYIDAWLKEQRAK